MIVPHAVWQHYGSLEIVEENWTAMERYPSWLYPIKNGATTMWERWNSWTQEHGFGPVEINSFNHYAYGAIGEWLYQSVGGHRAASGLPRISARDSGAQTGGWFLLRWRFTRDAGG